MEQHGCGICQGKAAVFDPPELGGYAAVGKVDHVNVTVCVLCLERQRRVSNHANGRSCFNRVVE